MKRILYMLSMLVIIATHTKGGDGPDLLSAQDHQEVAQLSSEQQRLVAVAAKLDSRGISVDEYPEILDLFDKVLDIDTAHQPAGEGDLNALAQELEEALKSLSNEKNS